MIDEVQVQFNNLITENNKQLKDILDEHMKQVTPKFQNTLSPPPQTACAGPMPMSATTCSDSAAPSVGAAAGTTSETGPACALSLLPRLAINAEAARA